MTDADRLAKLMKSVKNKSKFARENGIRGGSSMIYQHTNGLRPINLEAAQTYAKALGCTVADISPSLAEKYGDINQPTKLDNNIESTQIPSSYVPLISWVSAGQWRAAIDDRETYDHVPCPVTAHGKGTFALEVRGVSMYNPKGKDSFAEKDIIFVDPSRDANSGDYVVAMHADQYQATFKQLFCEDGRKFLKALNPDWQPNIQEINQDTILVGVVIAKVTTQVFK